MRRNLKLNAFVVLAVLTLMSAGPGRVFAAGNAKRSVEGSLNWAGYVSQQGKFSAITGTWTVPDVKDSKSVHADAAWVGIGGVSSSDLIQAGTEATTGGSGQITYSAWFEMLPDYAQPIQMNVQSGDSITVSIAEASAKPAAANNWSILIKDNTNGQSFKKQVSYTSTLSSAEWVEEMPSDSQGLMKIDNFKSINFTNGFATMNGSKVPIAQTGASVVAMVNQSGNVLAMPSSLSAAGTGFTVTQSHGTLGKKFRALKFASKILK